MLACIMLKLDKDETYFEQCPVLNEVGLHNGDLRKNPSKTFLVCGFPR